MMSAYSQRSGFWGAEWFQSMKRENERERERMGMSMVPHR